MLSSSFLSDSTMDDISADPLQGQWTLAQELRNSDLAFNGDHGSLSAQAIRKANGDGGTDQNNQQQKEYNAECHREVGMELSETKLLCVIKELENKALKAEFESYKMMMERNELRDKVAKMEQEQEQQKGKIDCKHRFNEILGRISEIEKRQNEQHQETIERFAKMDEAQRQQMDKIIGVDASVWALKEQIRTVGGENDGELVNQQQKMNWWDIDACHVNLELSGPNRLTVDYEANRENEWCSVFAKQPISHSDYHFFYKYFEIQIEKVGGPMAIGLGTKAMPLNKVVGMDKDSFGYLCRGNLWPINRVGPHIVFTSFFAGDFVGCGVDLANRYIFFTKNGHRTFDIPLTLSADSLFPCVSLYSSEDKILANFCPPFKFDVGGPFCCW